MRCKLQFITITLFIGSKEKIVTYSIQFRILDISNKIPLMIFFIFTYGVGNNLMIFYYEN